MPCDSISPLPRAVCARTPSLHSLTRSSAAPLHRLLYRYGDFSFLSKEWEQPASETNEDGRADGRASASSPMADDADAGAGPAESAPAAEPPAPAPPAPSAPPAPAPSALATPPPVSALAVLNQTQVPMEVDVDTMEARFGVTRDVIAAVAPFRACVQLEEACVWIGRFETLAEAARAYDAFVTKRKLRLPTNRRHGGSGEPHSQAAQCVRIVSGEGEGLTGEVSPADHGYFAVRVPSGDLLVKRGDEIALFRESEENGVPSEQVAPATKKRPRPVEESSPPAVPPPQPTAPPSRPGGAISLASDLGETGLRAHLRALSLELSAVKSQLEESHTALSSTCDLLHGLAHVEAGATLERERHLREELAWCDQVAERLAPGSDPELHRLLATRREECVQAVQGTRAAASELNLKLAGIRSALGKYFEAHQPSSSGEQVAPPLQIARSAGKSGMRDALPGTRDVLPAARTPAPERRLVFTAPASSEPAPGSKALGARVSAYRKSLIGRLAKVTVGKMADETGTIVALNGRYLQLRFNGIRDLQNKTLETLELLPVTSVP